MNLPYPRWLFTGGVIIAIAICLIWTSIASDHKEQGPPNRDRVKKDGNQNNLLRDHWNLVKLFKTINMSCELLSGKRNSNETINMIFNLTETISIEKLIDMDFYKLKKELEELFNTIDSIPYSPMDPVDYKAIIEGFRGISRVEQLQTVSDSLKKKEDFNVIEAIFRFYKIFTTDWDWGYNATIDKFNGLTEVTTREQLKNLRASYYFSIKCQFDAEDEVIKVMKQLANPFVEMKTIIEHRQNAKPFDETVYGVAERSVRQAKAQYDAINSLITELNLHQITVFRLMEFWKSQISRMIAHALDYEAILESKIPSNAEKSQFYLRMFVNSIDTSALANSLKPIESYAESLYNVRSTFQTIPTTFNKVADDFMNVLKKLQNVNRNKDSLKNSFELLSCFSNPPVSIEAAKPFTIDELVNNLYIWNRLANSTREVFDASFDELAEKFSYTKYNEFDSKLKALIDHWKEDIRDEVQKLVNSPDFEEVKNMMETVKKVAEFRYANRIRDPDREYDIAWDYLQKAERWINKTDFSILDPNCKGPNFKVDAVQKFELFHKSLGALHNKNLMPDLIKDIMSPLRKAQLHLRNLTLIGNRMNKYPESFHRNCKGLCGIMKESIQDMEDFKEGVVYLEKLFGTLNYQSTVKKLMDVADDVIAYERVAIERNSEVWKVSEYFQWMKGNKTEISKTFQKVQNLESIHNTEKDKWTSFESLQSIYKSADSIKSPIDWIEMNDQMDRYFEETYKNNEKLRTARRLTEQMAQMILDLEMEHVVFGKAMKALPRLDMHFAKFFKWAKPEPTGNSFLTPENLIILFGCLSFVASASYLIWLSRTPKRKRRLGPEDRKDDPEFVVTWETIEFYPYVLQACRLPFNKRDSDGFTPLFMAVWDRNFDEAKRLVKLGAALDAACGPDSETALHVAARRGDKLFVDLLLKNGADPKCRDALGRTAKKVCSSKNFTESSFARYYDFRKHQVIPKVKRDFYVLIVDCAYFPEEDLEFLPNPMEIVYGYREGEVDLDDFTHFCMAPASEKSKELEMDLDDLLTFEILSKPGMIVSIEWLSVCIDNISNMDLDFLYLLTDTRFEKKTNHGAITRIKNDIHKLRPPLLHDCELSILATNNRVMRSDQDDWIRIIESFGGYYVLDPHPSVPERLPIHASSKHPESRIYTSIVLCFKDSVLKERWTIPENHISILGMGWLPESIVRYSLISANESCLRNEPKIQDMAMIYEQGSERNKKFQ